MTRLTTSDDTALGTFDAAPLAVVEALVECVKQLVVEVGLGFEGEDGNGVGGEQQVGLRRIEAFDKLEFVLIVSESQVVQSSVTYDRKAIMINGQRRILFAGSIHYPRSTPDIWEDLIQKAKDGGLDVIETYVFWNVHEPSPGNYSFEGRYDIVRFIKTLQRAGLYAHLRIGPYVCAEWNFGGFPVWLKFVPGISFRSDNEPFKRAMQGFTEKIVGLMKSNNLLESQGDPIILSQNEYGAESKLLGAAGSNYVNWAAKMAVETGTGVPWVMCKEDDAPVASTVMHSNPTNPTNQQYGPRHGVDGRFSEFGGSLHQRPAEDLAFADARFIQKGGSFYHGGTNFGRMAGGPFITTSYDYDAPVDEYGLIRQPKYGHLKELHKAIKMWERALVAADPIVTSFGNLQQAHMFTLESGDCAAFLSNYDTKSAARVLFNNMHYNLPPWSISILPDCRNAVFNTAKMLPTSVNMLSWESYDEDISALDDSLTISANGLLEQINVTRDASDCLWYTTSVDIGSSESFLHGGELATLIVQSTGHAVHIFINGQLAGSAFETRENRRFTFTGKVNLHTGTKRFALHTGTNRFALLSVAVECRGHFESWNTGILGPVALHGLDQGKRNLSWQKWTYQVELKGEAMNLVSPNGISSIKWMEGSLATQKPKPLRWHKAYFNAPEGAISFGHGKYGKSYAGTFRPPKCQLGCGQPTQRWRMEEIRRKSHLRKDPCPPFVPRSLSITRISRTGRLKATGRRKSSRPKVHLHCSSEQAISSIKFASFGTPLGTCGSYQQGPCHGPASYAILEKKCVGKQRCAVTIANSNFGHDSCPNVLKRLLVEAVCAPMTSTTAQPGVKLD
ncbi:Beta-galactosidase 5 [Hibiscus syriacus]|uniref:beta-galactosidase n=1 Tax=Hibiscus syriacus TaxID=106335 RepID=A0A6A3BGA9_HIBSY|nr:Beta-galactosidase 5 [Hibiscus syriacus]